MWRRTEGEPRTPAPAPEEEAEREEGAEEEKEDYSVSLFFLLGERSERGREIIKDNIINFLAIKGVENFSSDFYTGRGGPQGLEISFSLAADSFPQAHLKAKALAYEVEHRFIGAVMRDSSQGDEGVSVMKTGTRVRKEK